MLWKQRKSNLNDMDVETDQKQQLTDKEAEILFGKKLLGTNSPQTLLSTVWLNNIEVPSY